MTKILPDITQTDLGKTVISETEGSYTKFIDNNIDNSVYTIKQGYIEFVESDGSIKFVKRLDNTQTLITTIYSNGIISGLDLQLTTGNVLKITAGKAKFTSGIKSLPEQTIAIPSGTTTLYYLFIDASNMITSSEQYAPDPTQLTLGAVYTSGTSILGIFLNKRDILETLFDRFSDLIYALGYFYSGFALTYDAANSKLVSANGVIHNNPNGDKRWGSVQKVSLQKIYNGNTFGPTSDTINVAFLKEISLPNGSSTTIPANTTAYHFIHIDRSTGKYYLLISDRTIPKPIAQVTIPELASLLNSTNIGQFLEKHCVLLGAIGIYSTATANTEIVLIQIHRGISGARNISTGVYPSPLDYSGGGILKAKIGQYYLFQPVDSYILQTAPTLKIGNYAIKKDNSNPNLVSFTEYKKTLQSTKKIIANINFTSIKVIIKEFLQNKLIPPYLTINGIIKFGTNNTLDSSQMGVSSGLVYSLLQNTAAVLPTAPPYETAEISSITTICLTGGNDTITFRIDDIVKSPPQIHGYSYADRKSLYANQEGMYITQTINNEQPKKYKLLFTRQLQYNTVPTSLIKNDTLKNKLKTKMADLYSKRPEKKESWSVAAKKVMFSAGKQSFIGYSMNITPSNPNPPILPLQPNDVIYLDSNSMDDDTFEHFLVKSCLAGVLRSDDTTTPKENLPHYDNPYILREIFIPYANIQYKGLPT